MLPPTPILTFPLPDYLQIENVFVPLPDGKRCAQVIAHYNPCRVVGSPRAGGCTPLTPAATHRTPPYRKTENHEATDINSRATRQGWKRTA